MWTFDTSFFVTSFFDTSFFVLVNLLSSSLPYLNLLLLIQTSETHYYHSPLYFPITYDWVSSLLKVSPPHAMAFSCFLVFTDIHLSLKSETYELKLWYGIHKYTQ